VPDATHNTNLVPKGDQELRKLLERAHKGDASTLPALRQILENPVAIDALGGDLAQLTEHRLIQRAAGKDFLLSEALSRKLELMRAELAGPSPSPVERLLVSRVVVCWLYLHDLEARFVQANGCTIVQADYQQRALTHAQRRYLAALKTLATVRRLALPALQVNIAQKQVNKVG
jgi:hypothetical protein